MRKSAQTTRHNRPILKLHRMLYLVEKQLDRLGIRNSTYEWNNTDAMHAPTYLLKRHIYTNYYTFQSTHPQHDNDHCLLSNSLILNLKGESI